MKKIIYLFVLVFCVNIVSCSSDYAEQQEKMRSASNAGKSEFTHSELITIANALFGNSTKSETMGEIPSIEPILDTHRSRSKTANGFFTVNGV